MIFLGIRQQGQAATVFYKTTWHYDYHYMLCFFQKLIDADFHQNIDYAKIARGPEQIDFKEELIVNHGNIGDCKLLEKESRYISIAGYSEVMESNIRITLWNQTNRAKLEVMKGREILKKDKRSFDEYMNSIEILGHVKLALEENEAKE